MVSGMPTRIMRLLNITQNTTDVLAALRDNRLVARDGCDDLAGVVCPAMEMVNKVLCPDDPTAFLFPTGQATLSAH